MLRIGICDDQSQARDTLRGAIERTLREDGQVIYEFSSGEGVLRWLDKHQGEIDLLLLDVEMGGMDGMETARRIRERDNGLILVFVTGYADFAVDGYAVQALDYVLKPVREDRLAQVLARVQALLREQEPQTFVVRNAEGMYRIPLRDIMYFYSDKRRVILVTRSREYPFYDRLDQVEQQVGEGFVRIHQRYLVRAQAVEQVGSCQVALGGVELPISRALRSQATMRLAKAMLGDKAWG